MLLSLAAHRSAQTIRMLSSSSLTNYALRKRIDSYISSDPVVVFMKGTKQEPRCGFSKNVAMVLEYHQIVFKDYDVLNDEELRDGIKKYSEWPTIPQGHVLSDFESGDVKFNFCRPNRSGFDIQMRDKEKRHHSRKKNDKNWIKLAVYFNGEFVGGSDILVQMHTDGEITDFFDKGGIKSRFSETKENA